MTLTGTLIFGENGEITPLPARTTDQDLIKAMMEGGSAKIYHCNDSDTERLISPREASAEGVTLYRQESITVSPGDRMRFSKSDTERGYVANSVWRVESISGDSVTLNDGKSTRTVTPAADKAEAHVDLAYAITTHGAQGASEPFSIELEGVTGARERMVSFESAYVALSRMKQHTQVYTDDRKGWTDAVSRSQEKASAHDVLEPLNDRAVKSAEQMFGRAIPLTPDEEKYAQLRLEKQRQQQARIQNEII
ncbi:hypothetical protein AB190_01295 (plasmid) [Enterobacter asburiae]|nr:hypothetical protein AB190_01295 [Enterobacter asburiae]